MENHPQNRYSILSWFVRILLAFLMLTFFVLFVFRFVPPPFTMMMLYQEGVALMHLRPHAIKYDWTTLENIDPSVVLAVIAAEDQKFLKHRGFDYAAMSQAWRHRHQRKYLHGGSTITQQTAKNLFLIPTQNISRKVWEAYLTVLMEFLWPKERILEVYLNIAQFGDGIYGVGAAAEKFFHKTPDHLTKSEAALLAAVLPNPRRFQVNHPSEYVLARQRWISSQMAALGGSTVVENLIND